MNAIKYFASTFRKKHPTYYTLAIIVIAILIFVVLSGLIALIIVVVMMGRQFIARLRMEAWKYSMMGLVAYFIYTLRNGIILKLDFIEKWIMR